MVISVQLIHVDFVQNSSVLCVSFRKILPHVFGALVEQQHAQCALHTVQLNHPWVTLV